MKLLIVVILTVVFFSSNVHAQTKAYSSLSMTKNIQRKAPELMHHETQFAFIVEVEKNNIFGVKFFCSENHGFFVGAKFTVHKPDGEQYNWSQERAKTFYKSAYEGYSKTEYYGLNGGGVYMLLDDLLFVYGGIGFLYSIQYPQYYDNTFTKWSNHYYLEDGSISSTKLDFVTGMYCKLGSPVLSVGYSRASNGLVLGVGVGF